jgi:antirestriction protein
MSNPTNSDDVIDSRDIIARIEELEGEREDLSEADAAIWDEDNAEELAALKKFADQAEGYCDDWHRGATLIRDSYFEEYARQFADDIGAIDAKWPTNCIDWEAAAKDLQSDYSAVEFDGVTYWMR